MEESSGINRQIAQLQHVDNCDEIIREEKISKDAKNKDQIHTKIIDISNLSRYFELNSAESESVNSADFEFNDADILINHCAKVLTEDYKETQNIFKESKKNHLEKYEETKNSKSATPEEIVQNHDEMKMQDLKHNTVPQNDNETQIHKSKIPQKNKDQDKNENGDGDGDGQDFKKNENDKNDNINKQPIDDEGNYQGDDSDGKVKNKLNLNLASTERLEKVKNIGINNDKSKVNQDSNIEIEENKNKFRSEAELCNKEFINQICDFLSSSITTKIDSLIAQVLECKNQILFKNNEKIDNNTTILNKNNEILNGNSNTLSSLSSSMLDLKNIICLLPKTTSIESKYLSVNSILSELHNMLTKKADQDFIQSKLESQFHQIKKLREEFKTEYKQLLDGKDKEIKQLNKQLKEQRTETEKYRQKLDKQTVEYATDKQKLEQHEKTILENKSLIESLKREINDSLKCAEDAVCKQSILQSKLDDQTKLHKEKLKVKTDKLKEEIKRKKEKIKNLKEESKRQKEKAKRQKEESKREKEEAIIQMEKSRKQNDEDKKKKEEQQIIIMNLEDKLKDQTSIADKAKEDINFKEDFIKELNKDKDNLEKNIKDLNMKLNKDEKTIKDLEMELSKSGEDNKVLEERIKCIEKEDKKILAEQKDETDKINDQLNKNLKKLEILKQKYYNERYMMIPNLRYDIKELTSMKQTSNLLRYKFHLLLNHMTELDSSEDFKLIDSLFECIMELENSKNYDKVHKEIYQNIIDFLYKLKDKFPSSSQKEQDEFDVFNKIMEFMTENSLMPSEELIMKYKSSKTNSQLEIPDYETLNHHIEMKVKEYELLIKNTKRQEEFVYFFDNNNIEIIEQIGKEIDGKKYLIISHCSKNSNEMIGVGQMIYSNGEIYQGYFKANKLHFYGRTISADSKCYTGRYINNKIVKNKNGEINSARLIKTKKRT